MSDDSRRLKPVDVVVVGGGWAGSIMAKEMTEAGRTVVMLERGPDRSTAGEGAYPASIDELEGNFRYKLFQDLSKNTVTIRNNASQTALPYRRMAAFLPGEGVGGAGLHWSGVHFRMPPDDLRLRSRVIEKYGAKFIPEGMNLQDYGVTYEELEPFFDKAEKVFGTSGEAYKVNGQVVGQGNVFAPSRSDHFPLPPLKDVYTAHLFRKAAEEVGFHPYSLPAANASQQYTNPYGVQMGPCNFCGYCSGYACYMYSKASPNVNILPVLRRHPLFELRANCHVLRVERDSTGTRATGVTYTDADGKVVTQPAEMVILTAFQFHNVRLMLLSGIGKPYDPVRNEGVVGRNFVYQNVTTSVVWLDPKVETNQYIGAGGGGVAFDDFNSENFDHGPLGFVGGSPVWVNQAGVKAIAAAHSGGPPGTPRWGSAWKAGMIDTYRHSLRIDAHGANMAYRDVYLDLDPTWKDAYGQPLLRMTFDWKDNDIRMNRYVVDKIGNVAKAMGARNVHLTRREFGKPFDTRQYQTTHLGGGAVMGTDPQTSALNRYMQSWDVHNVFVIGANAFPQGTGYNPTGMVAALAYWAAHHIRTTYPCPSRPAGRMRGVWKSGLRSLVVALLVASVPGVGQSARAQDAPAPADLVTRGEYVAEAADCGACHTVPGGAPFAGGMAFHLPTGTLYAPNITPDVKAGIGQYSEAEFIRAIRQGIRRDGATLYPAMPYPSYARMTDDDLHALYAYFMHGVRPVSTPVVQDGMHWPLSMRWPLTVWRRLFAPDPAVTLQGATARTFPDPVVARGAYLVEGPGHCGACHTPRAVTMQEKALTAEDGPLYLSGGASVDGWRPVSLRGENRTGLGRWSEQDIVRFLATGRMPLGAAFGGMTDAINHGTQHMTADDQLAIARYLKTLSPTTPAKAPGWAYDPAATTALRAGDVSARGARHYVDSCAACHRTDGRGYPTTFPPLAGNPVVMDPTPDSLIRIVLEGNTLRATRQAPSAFVMPGFAARMDDAAVADTVSFIRAAWGNDAPAVNAADVARIRRSLSPEHPPVSLPMN